jgi:hypothetical protein
MRKDNEIKEKSERTLGNLGENMNNHKVLEDVFYRCIFTAPR